MTAAGSPAPGADQFRLPRQARQHGTAGDGTGGDGDGPAAASPAPPPPGNGAAVLDWLRLAQLLDPLRRRWDLAIVVNLAAAPGPVTPGDLLATIRAQADRELSPQVLSARLHAMEDAGYVRHRDLSKIPLLREYWLLPAGETLLPTARRLLAELAALEARLAGRQPAAPAA